MAKDAVVNNGKIVGIYMVFCFPEFARMSGLLRGIYFGCLAIGSQHLSFLLFAEVLNSGMSSGQPPLLLKFMKMYHRPA